MAKTDARLLDLLTPILLDHADAIEAVLPPELRGNWRKAVAYTRRSRGPKALDHQDLLLAMAGLDIDEAGTPRELAARVISRLPTVDGASMDDRVHVELPDGSRPARKDLLDRLVKRYDEQRTALIAEVFATRRLVERASKRVEWLKRQGVTLAPRTVSTKQNASSGAKLRALTGEKSIPRITAHQVDAVREAIRKAAKKP